MVQSIWEELLKIIEQEVGSHVVHTWLKAVSLKSWDGTAKIALLQVPNQFVQSWVQSHYQVLLETHLSRLFNVSCVKLKFVTSIEEDHKLVLSSDKMIVPAIVTSNMESLSPPSLSIDPTQGKRRCQINRMYLFDTFVVGPSNQLAYAAAQAVTQKPGKIYNPLFIYGGSGLGKTHLLHAIGNEVKLRNKKLEVLYQTTDRFVSEFIGAIRFDKVHQFKVRYRDVDLLLIDDVQFISNKEQTQEAFFHIFNMLYEAQKQIVFSSDTDPGGINGLAERLRSRFEWGLVTDIGLPTLETKTAILQKKVALGNYHLDEEVIAYIASRPVFNIRELEGSLIRVMAYASLANQSVSVEMAKRSLARTRTTGSQNVDFRDILRGVHKHSGISMAGLRSAKRTKDVVLARHIAMYLMKKLTNRSLEQIGAFFGGKDHTTVLHAISKIEHNKKNDKDIEILLSTIEDELLR